MSPLASDRSRAAGALVAAGAAWLHWKRFHVPITVAAGAAAVVGLRRWRWSPPRSATTAIRRMRDLMLGCGAACSASACSCSRCAGTRRTRRRVTRRSDVAFWLHLLAAPMIVHPVFTLLGLNDGSATIGEGLVVVLLYVVLGRHRAGDRPPRLARLGAGLCALRADRLVRADRRGRAQRRADRAGHRLGPAAAVGLLAPGAAPDRRPPAASAAAASCPCSTGRSTPQPAA